MSSRPVVAVVSNALTPYRSHYHRRIARELAGIELWSLFTHGVSNAPWSQDAEADIRPVQFGPGEPSDGQSSVWRAWHEWRKGGRIITWLREHDVKAVVLVGYNDAGRLRVLRWCRSRGVPCFIFGDSNIRGDAAAWWKRRFLPSILRSANGVFACGELGRQYFQRYGVPDEHIYLCPYEPDYDLIRSVSDQDVRAARVHWNLAPDRRTVVYGGRLVTVKRVDLVIRAFEKIAPHRPEWDLLIVGDGPMRAELERLVPVHLRNRVFWTGFVAEPRRVAALYRGADALVLPSDTEPWGVVINEAVAAGLAVVATDTVGAAHELVRDGVNGRIVPAGDLDGLANAFADVTDRDRIDGYKAASARVLAAWRDKADPVAGLADALAGVGITAR